MKKAPILIILLSLRFLSFSSEIERERCVIPLFNRQRKLFDRQIFQGSFCLYYNFSSSSFKKASFIDSDFSFSFFNYADFEEANLSGCLFGYSDFSDANFKGADLKETCFGHCTFNQANFMGADLRGAYLNYADFSRAFFDDSTQLAGAQVTDGTLWTDGVKMTQERATSLGLCFINQIDAPNYLN